MRKPFVVWGVIVGLGFLAGLSPRAAEAQTGTTAVSGDVTDAQGAAIGGAKVTVTLAGTETGRSAETDQNGHYQFQSERTRSRLRRTDFAE